MKKYSVEDVKETKEDVCVWVDDFHGYVTQCDPEFCYDTVPEICDFCNKPTEIEE